MNEFKNDIFCLKSRPSQNLKPEHASVCEDLNFGVNEDFKQKMSFNELLNNPPLRHALHSLPDLPLPS